MTHSVRLDGSAYNIDISIVLNIHNESGYLLRTLRSIEQAWELAASTGLRAEIVCVMDRPDALTREWVRKYDFSSFSAVTILEVDHGSLGPSRNSGITHSSGEYILLHDADDLISENYIIRTIEALRSSPPRTIAFPHLLFSFGKFCYIHQYLDLKKIDAARFLTDNLFTSRVTAHRSVFSEIMFEDVRLSNGFAFEDWGFSAEAVARGFNLIVAPRTILFYRKRHESLLDQAKKISNRQPKTGQFHKPSIFVKIYERSTPYDPDLVLPDVKTDAEIVDNIHKANAIDGAVDVRRAMTAEVQTNSVPRRSIVDSYYEVCKILGDQHFSFVFLVPFFVSGGAEKFMIHFMDEIALFDPEARILVLGGQKSKHHHWLERMPPQALFLDLKDLGSGLSLDEVCLITLRVLQTSAKDSVVFAKESEYSQQFVESYGSVVQNINYLFFGFGKYMIDGRCISESEPYNFFSEQGIYIKHVITDNVSYTRQQLSGLDGMLHKIESFMVPVISEDRSRRYEGAPSTKRILWASRLTAQKRPNLLVLIAKALMSLEPDVTIDVYGHGEGRYIKSIKHAGLKNLRYKGRFSDFAEIEIADYDAMIYTSLFDGLPNILLEAMSRGLFVIAPNVGASSEVLTPETGILLEAVDGEMALAEEYAKAISSLYMRTSRHREMALYGQKWVTERHSLDQFRRSVRDFILRAKADTMASKADKHA
jgi:glycosyltransferase involved in cell wall biosynthesis